MTNFKTLTFVPKTKFEKTEYTKAYKETKKILDKKWDNNPNTITECNKVTRLHRDLIEESTIPISSIQHSMDHLKGFKSSDSAQLYGEMLIEFRETLIELS